MTDVTVIVPTRHEATTAPALAARATAALDEVAARTSLLFVDDSDDETPEVLAALSAHHRDVSVIHREPGGRHGGLAGAVVAGFAAADADVVAVMDGDLQHPPEALGALLGPLLRGEADVAVGSRFVANGHAAGLDGVRRRLLSRGAGTAARVVVRRARSVHDPLSGFFAVRREVLDHADLHAEGFKILLELLAAGHWSRVVEVPYGFAARPAGASKANFGVGVSFLHQLARLARERPAARPRRAGRCGWPPRRGGTG